MPQIGYLSEDRLRNIPKRQWAAHEFSFYLHDLIAHLTSAAERHRAGHIQIKIETEKDIEALREASDPIDFLSVTGRTDEERRLMVNHICAALLPDMLHFIHAGLTALEKRKFTLAFACLRKPFNEGMPLIALLCADEEKFFTKFKTDPVDFLDGRRFHRTAKRLAIEAAIAKCSDLDFLSADVLYAYLFDFENPSGFAGLFDKAMHLVTRNSSIKTEAYNLNFIFKDPRQNDVYESSYQVISYVLLCIHLMQVELLKRMHFPADDYLKQLSIRAAGTYQALFLKGRSEIAGSINETLGGLMKCPVCNERVRLRKRTVPMFFVTENLECDQCGHVNQFPLAWLMSNHAGDGVNSQHD
ncbi:hypothetical protein [Pararhodobacter oceanensis]|uniref:Uncharacterized protein n=1 Tax=Pararhodobacter oceanensis TaxID=2172121 RepID=A0A2T8HPQ5_9RHOB|nr:hypothetical protein [Pararhodobacter oceanensis]PVH27396.1 hypothetical protein DDE20_17905 [Pararhodobacter oceanensis]